MLRRPPCVLLAALLMSPLICTAAVAAADDVISAVPLASPDPPAQGAEEEVATDQPAIASEFVVRRGGERSTSSAAPDLVTPYPGHPPIGRRYDAVTYRPRGAPYPQSVSGPPRWRGVAQLHAGVLDPEGPAEIGFNMGFRAGHEVADMFQLGVGLDWRTKSGRVAPVQQRSVGPGGEIIVTEVEASHYSSNLLPVLLYAQLSGPKLRLTPYVGGAGSWQVLFLQADDYVTGQRFSATYSGWGWQVWGGASLRVVGRTKLIAEVFMNQATVGRDLYDPYTGVALRESISTDGVGARYGVSWGF